VIDARRVVVTVSPQIKILFHGIIYPGFDRLVLCLVGTDTNGRPGRQGHPPPEPLPETLAGQSRLFLWPVQLVEAPFVPPVFTSPQQFLELAPVDLSQ